MKECRFIQIKETSYGDEPAVEYPSPIFQSTKEASEFFAKPLIAVRQVTRMTDTDIKNKVRAGLREGEIKPEKEAVKEYLGFEKLESGLYVFKNLKIGEGKEASPVNRAHKALKRPEELTKEDREAHALVIVNDARVKAGLKPITSLE